MLGCAAAAWAACPWAARATRICDAQLRTWDGTDVFALSAGEALRFAKDLTVAEVRLRKRLPSRTWPATRPVRLSLRQAGHLGRVYSRAYRSDPTDGSLPQEAAFENSLLDLRPAARRAGLRACAVRLAAP